ALERNLYLTIQLLELGIPLVLAFNMMDEVRANGYIVDIDAIGRELGVRALAISASNEQGIKELAQEALVVAEEQLRPRSDFYTEAVGDAVIRAIKIVENRAVVSGLSPLFAAS
ncbi:MAG: FeoB small GTPase domain-containing protein, partial [Oscillospiraceae bacterium]